MSCSDFKFEKFVVGLRGIRDIVLEGTSWARMGLPIALMRDRSCSIATPVKPSIMKECSLKTRLYPG